MEEKKEEAQGSAQTGGAPAAPEGPRPESKALKAAKVFLTLLFLLLLGAALLLYSKVFQLHNMISSAEKISQGSAFDAGIGAMPPPARIPLSTRPAETSALTGFIEIEDLARSAYEQAAEARAMGDNSNEEEVRKAAAAFRKYADRPIVKEFLAAAKKDPNFAKMLAKSDGNDPMAFAAALRNMNNMNGLMLKFAMRKDFMPFLREVLNDPDIRPMMKYATPAKRSE